MKETFGRKQVLHAGYCKYFLDASFITACQGFSFTKSENLIFDSVHVFSQMFVVKDVSFSRPNLRSLLHKRAIRLGTKAQVVFQESCVEDSAHLTLHVCPLLLREMVSWTNGHVPLFGHSRATTINHLFMTDGNRAICAILPFSAIPAAFKARSSGSNRQHTDHECQDNDKIVGYPPISARSFSNVPCGCIRRDLSFT